MNRLRSLGVLSAACAARQMNLLVECASKHLEGAASRHEVTAIVPEGMWESLSGHPPMQIVDWDMNVLTPQVCMACMHEVQRDRSTQPI